MSSNVYFNRARQMNPIDDTFFQKMAEGVEFCQEILRVFLQDEMLEVTWVQPQYSIKNIQGRSVILDVYCVSGEGKSYNVEVQKSDRDDHQKRVRYNSSCLTANITDIGTKFENIPDVCVVYITKNDFLKKGKAIYHIERVIKETNDTVCNGFTEIYVNTEVKDGSKVSMLMTLFTENDAYDKINFPETSKRKYHFKEEEEGIKEMCEIMEQIKAEGKEEGIEQGKTTMQTLINCLVADNRFGELTTISDNIEKLCKEYNLD